MLGERPTYLSDILSIENDVNKINVLRWSEQRVCEKTQEKSILEVCLRVSK